MTQEQAALSTEFINKLCAEYSKYNTVDPAFYDNIKVKRGLRNADGTGVVAGLTLIGNVHGYEIRAGEPVPVPGKLYYRGFDLEDLIEGCRSQDRYGYEEVSYLLLFGQLPTQAQLEMFNDTLADMRFLPEHFTEDLILKNPSKNIMNKLAQSVLGLYCYDENPDETSIENMMRQGMALIARFPVLMAYAYQAKRYFYDRDSLHIHFPRNKQSTAESILHTIRPDNMYTDEEAKLLDLCLMLHAEHGGGNNSAFSCRVLSSSGTDTYSAIAAAIGALKGPLHGGANKKVSEMFDDIKAHVPNWLDEGQVADYLAKMLRREAGDGSGLVYGMGHAIYTISDPRAVMLKKYARELTAKKGYGDDFKLIEMVERLSPEMFKKVKGSSKRICANVDMYSGLIYRTLGIPDELFTPIFATARIAGWIAHRMEEITSNARIMRPAYRSVAPAKTYIPLGSREGKL